MAIRQPLLFFCRREALVNWLAKGLAHDRIPLDLLERLAQRGRQTIVDGVITGWLAPRRLLGRRAERRPAPETRGPGARGD